MRILATRVEDEGWDLLGDVDGLERTRDPLAGDTDGLEAARALCVSVKDEVDAEVLEAAPELELVLTRSTGIDNVDVEACRKRGVEARPLPEYATEAVAEAAEAALTLLLRRVPEAAHRTRSGDWDRDGLLSRRLEDATVGVVGVGRIGKAVTHRLLERNVRVVGHDVEDMPGFDPEGFSWADGLRELLVRADAATLHVPLDGSTRRLVDEGEIQALGPDGVLVNTSRGPVVDAEAVADALETGDLGGAYLDVLEGEPNPDPHLLDRLAGHPRCIVAPHVAAYDERTARRRYELAADVLEAWASSQS
jgi:lactate dehydrogenase-like 2-hydroxyacid dehydrogenase